MNNFFTVAMPEMKPEKKRPKERKKIIDVYNEIPPIPEIRTGEASKPGICLFFMLFYQRVVLETLNAIIQKAVKSE